MKKFILLAACLLFLAGHLSAQVFTLVTSNAKTVKPDELKQAESAQTKGAADQTTLTFTDKDIRLVVETGPDDDMLSYRVQGIRNPDLVVPAGATLRILFVNMDEDMRHDLRFGDVKGMFSSAPDTTGTVGTDRLAPKPNDDEMQADEIVLTAPVTGAFKYFCSVKGHARGGMWGTISIGAAAPEKKTKPQAPKAPAKHDHHNMDDMPGMKKGEDMSSMKMEMASVTNIGDPMAREGSGTSWSPDSSSMYGSTRMFKDGGMLMLMANAFVRYTSIGSDRDVSVAGKGSRSRVDAPSMFMVMYSRPIGENTQLGLRAMLSADPLIERGYGYPLLFQTGEVYRGVAIHDRQHPHDLIDELAVTLSHKFKNNNSVYIYAGYPGEPALGPPTFVHRASAANNPDAPISHHWQDATHITWGVVTAGYSFGKVKLETSAFKGQEPDENRWNFDRPKLDSFSGRISVNPDKNWAFQFSMGRLKDPEPAEPDVTSVVKTTASAIYDKKFNDDRNWANTFVWGQNYASGQYSNSFLFESNYDFYKNAVFGRVERVQKSGHDLVVDEADHDKFFWLGSYSLGYVRDLVNKKPIDVGLGGMLTFNSNPASLMPYYGGTFHTGWQIFLRLRTSKMKH